MPQFFTTLVILFLWMVNSYGQLTIRKVKPSDTDPLISTFNTDSNYVYLNTSITPKNILVIHLPGTGGEPKRATLWGSLSANAGFHSIGLMYPNSPTVGSFCSASSDVNCFENVRREIIEGVNYSSLISINSQESILNRAKKLIAYLRSNFPAENWGQFLDGNGEIIYNKVIFSGHSQGGGHAAMIGKFYSLNRVICFSSPKDWSIFYDTAPHWLSPTGWQTSAERIFVFNHTLDEQTRQLEIWDSLSLNNYGAPVNVDINSSPYNQTRQLTTSYSVPAGDEHGSTIQDNKTPKISGIPVFLPVWTYMLTEDLTPLPVEFLSVNAFIQSKHSALIQWQIAAKQSIVRFQVERSLDAEQYETIGILASDESNIYEWTDSQIPASGHCFYRIRAIDSDGSFLMSNQVELQSSSESKLNIFPNPANNEIYFAWNFVPDKANTMIIILDIQGKILMQSICKQSVTCISVESMPSGIYLYQAITKDSFFSGAWVKQ